LLACEVGICNEPLHVIDLGKLQSTTYFQIIGLDVLIDENLNVYLLEINSRASLNIEQENEISPGVTQSELSILDRHVKSMVVRDAIELIRQPNAQGLQRFNSLEKIVPLGEPYENIMTIFTKCRYLFNKMTGARDKRIITIQNFTKCWKLCKLHKIPLGKLLAFDFDHVYKKACKYSEVP
jgi:hypothetical protein